MRQSNSIASISAVITKVVNRVRVAGLAVVRFLGLTSMCLSMDHWQERYQSGPTFGGPSTGSKRPGTIFALAVCPAQRSLAARATARR